MVWSPAMRAFGSTALISVLPTIILFAIPFEKGQQPLPYRLHNGLLAFASGGLLGDVFLHTIPHLLGGHEHHHESHDERNLGEIEIDGHDNLHEHDHHQHDLHEDGHNEHDHHEHGHHEHELHEHGHHEHGHHEHDHNEHDHHEHGHHEHELREHGHHEHDHSAEIDPHEHGLNIGLYILLGFALFFVFEKLIRTPHNHNHDAAAKSKKPKASSASSLSSFTAKLTSGGLLNLAADSLHNFTDGVAIGASFVGGKGLGLAVFLSILAHELPHEIGDFAILVKNGATAREAILLQFCTAIFAFIGTAVGLMSTHFEEMNEMLLALVSGGFVYLATMTVMPELFHDPPQKQTTTSNMIQTFIEVSSFAAGVFMMVIVAKLEVHDH